MFRPSPASALEDGADALAAGGAHGYEGAAAAALREELRGRGEDARAGGGKRVAGGKGAARDVEPRRIDGAEGRGQVETRAAEVLVLPGPERGRHLRGERLVDLVEVEVLERQPRALQHARHGIYRRHQESFRVIAAL